MYSLYCLNFDSHAFGIGIGDMETTFSRRRNQNGYAILSSQTGVAYTPHSHSVSGRFTPGQTMVRLSTSMPHESPRSLYAPICLLFWLELSLETTNRTTHTHTLSHPDTQPRSERESILVGNGGTETLRGVSLTWCTSSGHALCRFIASGNRFCVFVSIKWDHQNSWWCRTTHPPPPLTITSFAYKTLNFVFWRKGCRRYNCCTLVARASCSVAWTMSFSTKSLKSSHRARNTRNTGARYPKKYHWILLFRERVCIGSAILRFLLKNAFDESGHHWIGYVLTLFILIGHSIMGFARSFDFHPNRIRIEHYLGLLWRRVHRRSLSNRRFSCNSKQQCDCSMSSSLFVCSYLVAMRRILKMGKCTLTKCNIRRCRCRRRSSANSKLDCLFDSEQHLQRRRGRPRPLVQPFYN